MKCAATRPTSAPAGGASCTKKMAGQFSPTSLASPISKKGGWNHYEIEAIGSHVRTWLNGELVRDLNDTNGKRSGLFALQLHAGGPTEVRFRNLKLEVK